jgi:hypothetical protein
MKIFLSAASMAVLCFAVAPASADTTVLDDEGSFSTISGFARINTNGVVSWKPNANPPEFKGSLNPTFRSTTDSGLTLGVDFKGPTTDIDSQWGITVGFKNGSQVRAILSKQESIDGCVFQAQPVSVAGSPPIYVSDNETNMFAVIGQSAGDGNIVIQFYKDGAIALQSPNQVMLSWSCIVPGPAD